MKPLSVGRVRELFSYGPSTGVFTRNVKTQANAKVGSAAGTISAEYVMISIDNQLYSAHRLAWLHTFGVWPTYHIDHIDGDKRNNRLANLRDVARTVNMQNRKSAQSSNQSGLAGAMKNGNSWMARIRTNGDTKYLGTFPTAFQAHKAYLAAKRELHEGNTI
jgi:hypothetical protein